MSRSLVVGPMIHLGTLDPFQELTQRQLTELALVSEQVLYQPDQWMIRPGEPAHAMLAIVDGYAVVRAPDGSESTLGPGGIAAFPDVLVPGSRPAAVRAQTDVVALRVETDELRDLCAQNFAILAALLTYLARRATSDPLALDGLTAGGNTTADTPQIMDRVGRLLTLHRAPLLPSHSMDALAELAGRVEHVSIETGGDLWQNDVTADGFFVIASGEVERVAATGARTAIGPGGVPGFAESFAGTRYQGSARATRPSTLLRVPLDPFMDVIEDHFELAFSLLGRVASHLIAD